MPKTWIDIPEKRKQINFCEGPEGVKWELGFAVFWTGKMGFTALGLGINHWERDRQFQKWEWDFSFLAVIRLYHLTKLLK